MNLISSSTLQTLELMGIKFSPESWSRIAKGVSVNKSIIRLSFAHCYIPIESFGSLSNAIAAHPAIQVLDMSSTGLNDLHGRYFKRVISGHSEQRSEGIWKHKLRLYEKDSNFPRTGLFEIIISNNSISDGFVSQLVQALEFDSFISKLDLKGNKITKKGVKEIVKLIREYNKTLVNVSIQSNPGNIEEHSKELLYELLKNIKRHKKNKEYFRFIIEHCWIDKETLLANSSSASAMHRRGKSSSVPFEELIEKQRIMKSYDSSSIKRGSRSITSIIEQKRSQSSRGSFSCEACKAKLQGSKDLAGKKIRVRLSTCKNRGYSKLNAQEKVPEEKVIFNR